MCKSGPTISSCCWPQCAVVFKPQYQRSLGDHKRQGVLAHDLSVIQACMT